MNKQPNRTTSSPSPAKKLAAVTATLVLAGNSVPAAPIVQALAPQVAWAAAVSGTKATVTATAGSGVASALTGKNGVYTFDGTGWAYESGDDIASLAALDPTTAVKGYHASDMTYNGFDTILLALADKNSTFSGTPGTNTLAVTVARKKAVTDNTGAAATITSWTAGTAATTYYYGAAEITVAATSQTFGADVTVTDAKGTLTLEVTAKGKALDVDGTLTRKLEISGSEKKNISLVNVVTKDASSTTSIYSGDLSDGTAALAASDYYYAGQTIAAEQGVAVKTGDSGRELVFSKIPGFGDVKQVDGTTATAISGIFTVDSSTTVSAAIVGKAGSKTLTLLDGTKPSLSGGKLAQGTVYRYGLNTLHASNNVVAAWTDSTGTVTLSKPSSGSGSTGFAVAAYQTPLGGTKTAVTLSADAFTVPGTTTDDYLATLDPEVTKTNDSTAKTDTYTSGNATVVVPEGTATETKDSNNKITAISVKKPGYRLSVTGTAAGKAAYTDTDNVRTITFVGAEGDPDLISGTDTITITAANPCFTDGAGELLSTSTTYAPTETSGSLAVHYGDVGVTFTAASPSSNISEQIKSLVGSSSGTGSSITYKIAATPKPGFAINSSSKTTLSSTGSAQTTDYSAASSTDGLNAVLTTTDGKPLTIANGSDLATAMGTSSSFTCVYGAKQLKIVLSGTKASDAFAAGLAVTSAGAATLTAKPGQALDLGDGVGKRDTATVDLATASTPALTVATFSRALTDSSGVVQAKMTASTLASNTTYNIGNTTLKIDKNVTVTYDGSALELVGKGYKLATVEAGTTTAATVGTFSGNKLTVPLTSTAFDSATKSYEVTATADLTNEEGTAAIANNSTLTSGARYGATTFYVASGTTATRTATDKVTYKTSTGYSALAVTGTGTISVNNSASPETGVVTLDSTLATTANNVVSSSATQTVTVSGVKVEFTGGDAGTAATDSSGNLVITAPAGYRLKSITGGNGTSALVVSAENAKLSGKHVTTLSLAKAEVDKTSPNNLGTLKVALEADLTDSATPPVAVTSATDLVSGTTYHYGSKTLKIDYLGSATPTDALTGASAITFSGQTVSAVAVNNGFAVEVTNSATAIGIKVSPALTDGSAVAQAAGTELAASTKYFYGKQGSFEAGTGVSATVEALDATGAQALKLALGTPSEGKGVKVTSGVGTVENVPLAAGLLTLTLDPNKDFKAESVNMLTDANKVPVAAGALADGTYYFGSANAKITVDSKVAKATYDPVASTVRFAADGYSVALNAASGSLGSATIKTDNGAAILQLDSTFAGLAVEVKATATVAFTDSAGKVVTGKFGVGSYSYGKQTVTVGAGISGSYGTRTVSGVSKPAVTFSLVSGYSDLVVSTTATRFTNSDGSVTVILEDNAAKGISATAASPTSLKDSTGATASGKLAAGTYTYGAQTITVGEGVDAELSADGLTVTFKAAMGYEGLTVTGSGATITGDATSGYVLTLEDEPIAVTSSATKKADEIEETTNTETSTDASGNTVTTTTNVKDNKTTGQKVTTVTRTVTTPSGAEILREESVTTADATSGTSTTLVKRDEMGTDAATGRPKKVHTEEVTKVAADGTSTTSKTVRTEVGDMTRQGDSVVTENADGSKTEELVTEVTRLGEGGARVLESYTKKTTVTSPTGAKSETLSSSWKIKDAAGSVQTGWQFVDGNWYYANSDGTPERGERTIAGDVYFFNDDGKMKTGWHDRTGRGDWVWLNTSTNGNLGAMRKSEWANDGQNWYYVDSQGQMLSGWQWVNGLWFYLNPDHDGTFGRMLTGWQFDGYAWYYLDLTYGHMLRNQWIGDAWVNGEGVWTKL